LALIAAKASQSTIGSRSRPILRQSSLILKHNPKIVRFRREDDFTYKRSELLFCGESGTSACSIQLTSVTPCLNLKGLLLGVQGLATLFEMMSGFNKEDTDGGHGGAMCMLSAVAATTNAMRQNGTTDVYPLSDAGVNSVKNAWDSNEHGRPKGADIIKQRFRVALPVPDRTAQ
jgi:hypothetical protein